MLLVEVKLVLPSTLVHLKNPYCSADLLAAECKSRHPRVSARVRPTARALVHPGPSARMSIPERALVHAQTLAARSAVDAKHRVLHCDTSSALDSARSHAQVPGRALVHAQTCAAHGHCSCETCCLAWPNIGVPSQALVPKRVLMSARSCILSARSSIPKRTLIHTQSCARRDDC